MRLYLPSELQNLPLFTIIGDKRGLPGKSYPATALRDGMRLAARSAKWSAKFFPPRSSAKGLAMTDLIHNVIVTDPDTGEILLQFLPGIISDITTTDDGYSCTIRHAEVAERDAPEGRGAYLNLDAVPAPAFIRDAEGKQLYKHSNDPRDEQYYHLDGWPAWMNLHSIIRPITYTTVTE